MPSITRILFMLLLQAHCVVAAAEAERLGTLFYSPSERSTISSAREGKTGDETASGLAVSGIIKRDNGKGTVWINNKAVAEGQPVPPAAAPGITTQGITIDGKPVRVGETVNLVTGEKTDLIPSGAVSAGKKK